MKSNDIQGLLNFYKGRKFISVKDIEEYARVQDAVRDMMGYKVLYEKAKPKTTNTEGD